MKNSKLLILLSSLSPTELRRMRKIFQSPFFTINERHLVLYDLLRKYHPDFTSPKLSKEWVFEKLYPGKPFNDGLFRVMLREFTEMTEEYLLLLKLRKEKFERKKMLAQIYDDRNLYPLFEKETQKILQDLDENPFRDWEYYKEVYELNFAHFFHPSTQKMSDDDAPLLQMMEAIDRQFALSKLRIGSEMINRTKIYAKQYDIRLLEEIKVLAKYDFVKENVLFQLFVLLFQLYDATEEEKGSIFEELKLGFSQNFQQLRTLDQSLFLTQLINFTIKKINLGEANYYKEAFDLYKIGLEADLVLKQGGIDEAVYGNIVTMGCHAQEFAWVEQFMLQYKNNLQEEIRHDAYELNKGVCYFHQKDYENAQFQFMNYGYASRFQLKARVSLICTLYEQFIKDASLFDLLISQINAFEKYLHRNLLKDEYQKEVYLNFLSIIKKLATGIVENKNQKKLKVSIENQLKEKQRMVGKYWIEEKVKNLK